MIKTLILFFLLSPIAYADGNVGIGTMMTSPWVRIVSDDEIINIYCKELTDPSNEISNCKKIGEIQRIKQIYNRWVEED